MSAVVDEQTQASGPSWVWFSTHETIEKEIPSLTAIFETIVAVPLYWWIALKIGAFWPLAISAAIAPLVLLRSEASEKLGIKWFLRWEISKDDLIIRIKPNNRTYIFVISFGTGMAIAFVSSEFPDLIPYFLSDSDKIASIVYYIMIISVILVIISITIKLNLQKNLKNNFLHDFDLLNFVATPLAVLIISIVIRFAASIVSLRHGFSVMPKNFRRVILCTSPIHVPELVPGLERTASEFRVTRLHQWLISKSHPRGRYFAWIQYVVAVPILYVPSWLYRLTIKSTSWFWWPLAFLGGELQQATNPKLFQWKVMGSLWAKASIGVALATLLSFAFANLYPASVFENPLLTPFGYLLLVDWTLRPPSQVLALLGAALSIWMVMRVSDASGEYRIAQDQRNAVLLRAAERKFGRTEFLARVRLLVFIAFWIVVGVHALLYFNSKQCWFTLSPELNNWAVGVYGDRLPRPCQCVVWRVFGLQPLQLLDAR